MRPPSLVRFLTQVIVTHGQGYDTKYTVEKNPPPVLTEEEQQKLKEKQDRERDARAKRVARWEATVKVIHESLFIDADTE